jgi:NAD(P)-dependent dehydrogenase (short-subunit alcohol dehydrogenase family)
MNFADRVVLVTGAAGGIGRAIAAAFLETGAAVMANDMDGDRLREAATDLQSIAENSFDLNVGDVRVSDAVESMVVETTRRFGRIDILVNNAGIGLSSRVVDMSEDEWDAVLNTNLRGPFLLSRAAARHMIERGGGGKIINITSGSYKNARIGASHYCASKAALAMFTRVLALELAEHRVNVNSVAPGLIDIERRKTPPDYIKAYLQMVPWGRMGKPEEIAQAVLFLASEKAEYITGEILEVSGGSSAGLYFLPQSR